MKYYYLLRYTIRQADKVFTRHFLVQAVHPTDAVDRFVEWFRMEPNFSDKVTIQVIPIADYLLEGKDVKEIQ